jgi:hypothetical protein
MTSTGEFQINNLPLIIISIAIVALGVLGFLEFKKLYVKLNMISTKIDEINDNFNQEPKEIPPNQIPPPHIQKQMMMRRQEEMKKMQMQQQQMQQQQQQQMQQQSVNPHLQSEYKVHPKSSEEIVNDEKQSINNDTDDTDDKGESIISDSQSSIKIDIENDIDDIDDNDNDNDDDDNQSIMTIELDNKFKHLSIKALKDLCKENDLPISGNKTTLVSRLLENDQGNDLEN